MSRTSELSHTRDLAVIGCSAGGVEALPRLLLQLPEGLPASICIVQHMAATERPYLVEILTRRTQLPVTWAEQGASLDRGRVYVAPPDAHLLLADGHLTLSRGPRENHARPSIDKLFRSAAATYGARVIGILLTGMLEDGVAGLVAIRDAGGLTIVQEPSDAAFPELPSRALLALRPDLTLRLDDIGAAVRASVAQPVGTAAIPRTLSHEAEIDRVGPSSPQDLTPIGERTSLSCPDCSGPLWRLGDERQRRFRCYLGHGFSARELVADSSAQMEAALWSAVRALNDRAATLEMLAQDAHSIGSGQSAESYATRAREARAEVEVLRRFMLDLGRTRMTV